VFLGVDGNDPAALGLLLFVFVSVEFDFHLPADVAQELTEEWVDVIVFHVMCVARMSSRVSRSPAHPHATMSSVHFITMDFSGVTCPHQGVGVCASLVIDGVHTPLPFAMEVIIPNVQVVLLAIVMYREPVVFTVNLVWFATVHEFA
jgi:hypothetical protein